MNKNERQRLEALKNNQERAAWMNQKPNPLPVFRKGQMVSIYMGSGWSQGRVVSSTPKGCCVSVTRPDKIVNVYDARCIKPCKEEEK